LNGENRKGKRHSLRKLIRKERVYIVKKWTKATIAPTVVHENLGIANTDPLIGIFRFNLKRINKIEANSLFINFKL